MARPKGSPKLGGRKKGVPNKVTLERERSISQSGLTPLEYMLSIMRNEGNTTEARFEAAKAAAPYVHPKLAAVEFKGDPEAPIEHRVTIDAFTSRIARLAARAAEDEGDREPGS